MMFELSRLPIVRCSHRIVRAAAERIRNVLSIFGTGDLGKPPRVPPERPQARAGVCSGSQPETNGPPEIAGSRRRIQAGFGGVRRTAISGCRLANRSDQFGGAVREKFLSHLRTQRGGGLQRERPFSLG